MSREGIDDGVVFRRGHNLVLRLNRRRLGSLVSRNGGFPVHLVVRATKQLEPVPDVLRVEQENTLIGVGGFRIWIIERRIITVVPILRLEDELGSLLLRGRVDIVNVKNLLPDARRPFPRAICRPFSLRVEQERARPGAVSLPHEFPQQGLVPFESVRELALDLVDAIEELLEDWARFLERVRTRRELLLNRGEERLLRRRVFSELGVELDPIIAEVAGSIRELVSVSDPVLLDQDRETFRRPVERVETDLGQGRQLTRAVPPVRAVNEDVRIGEMNRADHDEDSLEDVGQVR